MGGETEDKIIEYQQTEITDRNARVKNKTQNYQKTKDKMGDRKLSYINNYSKCTWFEYTN